ncbi:MAG TPA: hypothetical protein VM576_02220 [Xanthomonadaceae bacterium]|nr:hypothetical protein [Xanthomonadaceae bacterium]
MNAIHLPLPADRFVAAPTPAIRIVAARRAEQAPAARAEAAPQAFTLAPFIVPPADALEAGSACLARTAYDTLSHYAAPATPALFRVC